MVSPLQTWQHPEPKRLWWALGGLSALVHVGVLGLSLPYLLDLMVAGGAGSAAIAPPIELVLVDPADTSASAEGRATTSEQTAPSAEEESPAATPLTAAAIPPPEKPAAANDSASSDPSSEDREQSQPQSNSAASEEEGASDTDSSDTDSSDTDSQTAASESSGSSSQTTAQTEETSDELPFLGGAETLPDPSESIATGDGTESSFAVSIVGHSPPPEDQQYDLKDTFPSVSEAAGATAVPLQRRADCDWFDFSQQQWTYRVAVAVDGSIDQMSLLTAGGDEREGQAIACLIERADLTLIPARQEGEAVYDDNLILTVEITKL